MLSGVPQSTVLGPLLFLTYINDLPDCVASSDTRLFADDSLLFRVINSQQDADYLQKDLTALEKWESEWQMSFHPEKCTVIRIRATKNQVINITYTLHSQVLQTTDSSKYLGVTLSDDLTWQKHVDITTSKANRTLGFIRRNLGDCSKQVKVTVHDHGQANPGVLFYCMGPKVSNLVPQIRASTAKGCQVCPLIVYRQDPRLCDKDGAGFKLGITGAQKIHLKTNDALQDTPSDSRGFRCH